LKNHDHPEVPLCCVCMSDAASAVFIPCGHLCLCDHCAKPVAAKLTACPLCRQFPTGVHHVYF
jgi:E3 ubiquitin-protein ligase XIAP/baculoviral IAP repeat-containing protein 7/8